MLSDDILEFENIDDASADDHIQAEETTSSHKRLGPAGLSLHYANIIIQIDTLVGVLFLIILFVSLCILFVYAIFSSRTLLTMDLPLSLFVV